MRDCQICGATNITEKVRECCLGGRQVDQITIERDYFLGRTIKAIRILCDYLPPDGGSSKDAISKMLRVFDNKEIIERLKGDKDEEPQISKH